MKTLCDLLLLLSLSIAIGAVGRSGNGWMLLVAPEEVKRVIKSSDLE